jgi:uncharacterized protein (TIGR03435 family)
MARAACFVCAALFSGAVFAQSGGQEPKFVLTDVRAMAPDGDPYQGNYTVSGGFYRGGIYELRHATILDLIHIAWGVDPAKVVGGPNWVSLDQFDVVGTAPEDTTPEDLNLMLRGLLKDRFKLTLHAAEKGFPAWVLTAGSKPQLRPSEGSGEGSCTRTSGALSRDGPVQFACRDITMAAFAAQLGGMNGPFGNLGQMAGQIPVVDRTALKGSWDFDISFTPPRPFRPGNTAEGVSIFDAVDKQLGLKLQMLQIPVPVLAIDSVNEKPSDNAPGVAAKPPASPLEFEVAAIDPFDNSSFHDLSGVERERALFMAMTGVPQYQPGGRVHLPRDTLRMLIAMAWHIAVPETIVGPKSLNSNYFAITAKASVPDLVPGHEPVGGPITHDAIGVMLQNLLKDRFKLAVHFENRTVPGYALVAAKPKLRPADPSNRAGCVNGPGPDGKDPRMANPAVGRLVTCLNMTVAQFAAQLRSRAIDYLEQYPDVVDATGIEGAYDFSLAFSFANALTSARPGAPQAPSGTAAETGASEPTGAITLAEALEKQLGLKLESRKVAAQVLVVDHVEEQPTEN